MNIVWSPEAVGDLVSLRAYIAEHDPAAAQRTAQRIIVLIETVLVENPHMGRPGRVPGTRELVITRTPYVVPYRMRGGAIEVLRVYHGARRWPDTL
ncbi:MAG: type II toxin-antitoxin system RelE/ParE family toxin [Variibacter sp.]|nr:type II toxin-antitoxin system RelE/ParE family toxin [Variibacter sp.]